MVLTEGLSLVFILFVEQSPGVTSRASVVAINISYRSGRGEGRGDSCVGQHEKNGEI